MKKTIWDINYGDTYFRIFGDGEMVNDIWQECSLDLAYRDNFSAFLTREEAKAEVEARKKKALALKPILDDAERRYLSAVIRPFRDRVQCITKAGFVKEYIRIKTDCDSAALPLFEKNTMYKGMEPDKEYTLEELGL